ncbi:hypothetical protein ACIGB8_20330 [Promicromonospora sukumoe]|uniref:hypothetical protein n=1 Tax=Promicromonospora sukumoe TaxID=88382 RepID=UPI0037C97961
MNIDLTRRGVLRGAAVASLLAAQSIATRTEAVANDGATGPRLELLGAADAELRSEGRRVLIPHVLGARIVVGSDEIAKGSRLRFSGPTDSYDISEVAVLGSATTGLVSDLPARATARDGDVLVTVPQVLAAGEVYTVVVGTVIGERYPNPAPGPVRSWAVQLETSDGRKQASVALATEPADEEGSWAAALAYSADRPGGLSDPIGWVTVHSVGPEPVPKGGEVLVLLDRAEGRPGLALGRAGASRSDTSRPVDVALARGSGGAGTYKIRIDDEIPAGKSIVIPVMAPDDGAPIRAIEYRTSAGKNFQRITGAESIEVLTV